LGVKPAMWVKFYILLIKAAWHAAPKPLSIFTTEIPLAQLLLSIGKFIC